MVNKINNHSEWTINPKRVFLQEINSPSNGRLSFDKSTSHGETNVQRTFRNFFSFVFFPSLILAILTAVTKLHRGHAQATCTICRVLAVT